MTLWRGWRRCARATLHRDPCRIGSTFEALMRATPLEALWIDLAAEHGLRRAEVACIHSADIVETLMGHDLVVHGKGGKLREVPLTRAMAAALLALVDDLPGGRGYLFPGDEDEHVSARWLGFRVNRLLAGHWTMHKLRHRAATRFWVSAEGDPYVVADLMGWANLSMVRTYVETARRAQARRHRGGESHRSVAPGIGVGSQP